MIFKILPVDWFPLIDDKEKSGTARQASLPSGAFNETR